MPLSVSIENASLNKSGTSVGSMVGIKVGGPYTGMGVGSIVAVAVWVGTRVSVTVALGDGIGDGVAVTDCPHAINNSPIARKTSARKSLFILIHSLADSVSERFGEIEVAFHNDLSCCVNDINIRTADESDGITIG